MVYTVTKNNYVITDKKSKIDIDYVHDFLTNSYWSPGVKPQIVKKLCKVLCVLVSIIKINK